MQYSHRQYGYIHYIVFLTWFAFVPVFWFSPDVPLEILAGLGFVFGMLGMSFRYLTVKDEGDQLAILYGPIPFFSKRIKYADITSVQRGRSSLVDGWGIHWFPGRGWTYNLWGYDCVELTLGKKTIRIGSDDADALAEFLQGKTAA